MNKDNTLYDLIVVGAGPAGLGASIYASRYKLNHLVIGTEVGGQVTEASGIENWAGEKSITGKALMDKFKEHAEYLGAKIIQAEIDGIKKTERGFEVMSEPAGLAFETKTLILALGMRPRKMDIPGEDELIGKGVSFCATCDAMFFRGKDVAVIGGGDSAATAAIHLSEFANQVYIVYPENDARFEPAWREKMEQNPKIKMTCCTKVAEIKGEGKVSGIVFDHNGEAKEIPVQGVFIEIGSVPGVALAHEIGVATDEQGYIIVKEDQQTNVENIFAAGDVTTNSNKFRQIITAVAEGAIAAGSVYRKLKLVK